MFTDHLRQMHPIIQLLIISKETGWQGIVRGSLEKRGWGAELGYYGFRHTSHEKQEEIKVFVLLSDELVKNWQLLDDFEGDGYKRILAKYELENGQIGVGNIYAINEAENLISTHPGSCPTAITA